MGRRYRSIPGSAVKLCALLPILVTAESTREVRVETRIWGMGRDRRRGPLETVA